MESLAGIAVASSALAISRASSRRRQLRLRWLSAAKQFIAPRTTLLISSGSPVVLTAAGWSGAKEGGDGGASGRADGELQARGGGGKAGGGRGMKAVGDQGDGTGGGANEEKRRT